MCKIKRKIAGLRFLRKKFELRGTIVNNKEQCVYCGLCEKACPVQAIQVSQKEKTWQINQNICVRCSHCVQKCMKGALVLKEASNS